MIGQHQASPRQLEYVGEHAAHDTSAERRHQVRKPPARTAVDRPIRHQDRDEQSEGLDLEFDREAHLHEVQRHRLRHLHERQYVDQRTECKRGESEEHGRTNLRPANALQSLVERLADARNAEPIGSQCKVHH